MATEIDERLARLERQLDEARAELEALRVLAEAQPATEPSVAVAVEPPPRPAPVAAPAPPDGSARLTAAWRALERGRETDALQEALAAFKVASAVADDELLREIGGFARVAASTTSGHTRDLAEDLRLRIEGTLSPTTPQVRAPARAAAVAPTTPRRHQPLPPSNAERLSAWVRAELTGARAFALVGGAVLLLGIIFLFVLAANRGWVGPAERVALGAIASLAAIVVGVALRSRYGRVVAAFGAVGAGIAGSYATLAAATITYSYLPSWAAMLAAAAIAAVGGAIAVTWSSQILAGLALVGAAVAPGLFALDDEISPAGTTFALLVFGAAIAVAAPRRWLRLEGVVGAVAIAQVIWLVADAPADDAGTVAVACVGALALLAAAVAWQAYGGETLEAPAAWFALAGAVVGLFCPTAVIADDVHAGLVLLGLGAVFAGTALVAARRWGDLAWAIGGAALLLGGVAVAFLVSGRSLTVVWAIEAAILAALARKLGAIRFHAAALLYLGAAAVNSLAREVVAEWPTDVDDMPRGAAVGLFVLAASAVAVGVLQPQGDAPAPSGGIAARLDPLWAALTRRRVETRAALALAGTVFFVGGLAAVSSGRTVTIVLAFVSVGVALAAFVFGERRLQPFSLGIFAFAVLHALAIEVPFATLAAERGTDVAEAVPSLLAIAAAAAGIAAFTSFESRGIAWLGRPEGPEETVVAAFERGASHVRATLALVAATAGGWAVGLLAIDVSYAPGQVVATAIWGALGVAAVVLAGRVGPRALAAAGFAYVTFALLKSAAFDWHELGDGGAATSLVISSAAVLAAGFQARWQRAVHSPGAELIAIGTGATAAVAGIVALGRWIGYDSRAWSLGAALVAVVLVAAGAAPYARRRAGDADPSLRFLTNGYWLVGLAAALFAESALVLFGASGTIALWGVTAGVLALVWKPLDEQLVWLAGVLLAVVSAVGAISFVTVPSRLVEASEHPATGMWALAAVVAGFWLLGMNARPEAGETGPWVLAAAAGLTLYGVSLVVLEIAERVSGATVTTDFQRGHTMLSALWGVGALALYVVGLARDRRQLRVVGLALFGLALAKLFLYDLASLSSITRAFSFLAVGSILLAAGFFAERLVKPDATT